MAINTTFSPHQLAYFAHQLTRRAASNSMDRMAGALLDAQVDLNPHQIDAALFATSNPLSKGVNWQGGGGFRYYKLAPSLLQQDRWGQWVINKDYNAEMLAAAICKLEGFTYAPSDAHYWQHGTSTESDFIYVTTQSLTPEQLQALSDEVGEKRSLLVCCSAFRGDANRYPNLTVKKIPKMVLQRCEWSHDDYSLNVENLPQAPKIPLEIPQSKPSRKAQATDIGQGGLFDVETV